LASDVTFPPAGRAENLLMLPSLASPWRDYRFALINEIDTTELSRTFFVDGVFGFEGCNSTTPTDSGR